MLVIGLMSGTSVDGIDAALVEFMEAEGALSWSLHGFACLPWQPELRQLILDCCRPDAPVKLVTALNFRLGIEFAAAAAEVAAMAGVSLRDVDAIASHGQTLWHQPTPVPMAGMPASGTLQVGEPSVIAERTGCLVIADFRCADMAQGGQGAPLVPYADFRLLASPIETRAVQNLGGIANVTLLSAGGSLDDVLAFDTGPGNLLLDALATHLTAGKQNYDSAGALAAHGSVCQSMLADCLEHAYFAAPPPKTTGREMFGADYAAWFRMRAAIAGCSPEDTLTTATALTAESIARAYRMWLWPRGKVDSVILGGGGVHNRTLVRMLEERLAPARLTTHVELGLPDDAKEAIAFALLGYSTLLGQTSNVPSATGARGPAVLGKIVLPPPTSGGKLRLRLDKICD
jgi:anhydro-N-acetylmuramic acid kinase